MRKTQNIANKKIRNQVVKMENLNISSSNCSTMSSNSLSTQNEPTPPWYNLLFTVICSFGIFTNVVNIAVFGNPKLVDKVYKCLFISSIADLIFLAISTFCNLFICGPACSQYFYTLIGSIYSLYIVSFGCNSLNLFTVLIEIFLSLQRYTLLINKPFLMNVSLAKVLPFLFFLSCFVNVPILTNYYIVPLDFSEKTYTYVLTTFGAEEIGKIIKSISTWTYICLTLGVLTTLSIMTTFKSREYFSKMANMAHFSRPHCSAHRSGEFKFKMLIYEIQGNFNSFLFLKA